MSNTTSGSPLLGHVKYIPLVIEDKDDRKKIKSGKLYLYSSLEEAGESLKDGPMLRIVAASEEGYFMNRIELLKCREFMKTGSYTGEEWRKVVIRLFVGDELGAIGPNGANVADEAEHAPSDLMLTAKLFSLRRYYSEDDSLREGDEYPIVSNFVTVDIKTTGELPITRGSLSLFYIDLEQDEKSGLKQPEVNLFRWIDLLVEQNRTLRQQHFDLAKKLENCQKEAGAYGATLQESSREHKRLVLDLEDKFYQILQSKKNRIWELERAALLNTFSCSHGNQVHSTFNEANDPEISRELPTIQSHRKRTKSFENELASNSKPTHKFGKSPGNVETTSDDQSNANSSQNKSSSPPNSRHGDITDYETDSFENNDNFPPQTNNSRASTPPQSSSQHPQPSPKTHLSHLQLDQSVHPQPDTDYDSESAENSGKDTPFSPDFSDY